jgi:hypothetical protein
MRWSVCIATLVATACRHDPPAAPREAKRDERPAPLSPDAALSRIEAVYRPGVQRCYETHLKHDPAARGRVTVTFTVDPSGRLSYREAHGIHPSVERCVEGAMMKWTFPRPSAETTFRLGLQLSSRS